jgi:hypothetical protein
MPRKSPYSADDTTRTCNRCQKTKPLDSEHYNVDKQGPHGWNRRCKKCVQEVKTESYHKKLNAMSEEEHYEFRAKQQSDGRKSRKRVSARLTDEEKAERLHKRTLREKIPKMIVLTKHLRFVRTLNESGQTWAEFYNAVSEALRLTYGCDYSATNGVEMYDDDGDITPEYRAVTDRRNEMIASETYLMLEEVNDDIAEWNVNPEYRRKLAEGMTAIDALTPEEWKWVRGYKPRAMTAREMVAIAPATLRAFDRWVDKRITEGCFEPDAQACEKFLDEDASRQRDPCVDYWRLTVDAAVPDGETVLERKQRQNVGLTWQDVWLSRQMEDVR